jgi:hypothetical protein
MTGTSAGKFSAFPDSATLNQFLSTESGLDGIGVITAFTETGNPMKNEPNGAEFRYYMHDGPKTFRFELAGPLLAEGARSLEQDWRTASSVAEGKTLVVDLSFVTAMDAGGLDLMRRWYREGAQFAANSAEGRRLVESITGNPATEPVGGAQEAYRPWMSLRIAGASISLLFLLLPSPVLAAAFAASPASLAFGRYVASMEQNAPFSESGNVVIEIEARLPGMDKRGHLVAIRRGSPGDYEVLRIEGDSIVRQQVIARYLSSQTEAEALPASSIAVTPANYNFRYVGSVKNGGQNATPMVYVFEITPKKKRDGLIRGQLWIDGETGIAVRQTGYVVKNPSVFVRRIAITRDLTLSGGTPSSRTTHVEIETRIVGRAEMVIVERPLIEGEENLFGAEGGWQ